VQPSSSSFVVDPCGPRPRTGVEFDLIASDASIALLAIGVGDTANLNTRIQFGGNASLVLELKITERSGRAEKCVRRMRSGGTDELTVLNAVFPPMTRRAGRLLVSRNSCTSDCVDVMNPVKVK
jgi:hypothetical protein